MSILISETIEKLRQLTQSDILANWRYCPIDLPAESATQADLWDSWEKVELNAKRHIAWESGQKVLWLGQKLVIPPQLNSYPLTGLSLRLALTWWAEYAQIFVNGELVQEGDLFDSSYRVLLTSAATAETEFEISLRLVSPIHDRGALMRSLALYESDNTIIDPSFVADELAVLQLYLAALKTDSQSQIQELESPISLIDWAALPKREKFARSLSTLQQNLQAKIPTPQSKIYLLGHAHLDMAWLWPVSETWEAAQRTFASVLKLQQDFPELIFCHSTPALYEWMEQHRPDLFTSIQDRVAAGCWEIVGGMWIEPDINLLNGESIARQILYGQRYTQAKFNQITSVAWLPDTFGFCWQLPQLLKQGGIDYFVTQKLRWNDSTKFPYSIFWWHSPDGTKIFSFMSALIGESIEPIKMANYAIEWQTQTNLKDALWLPGVGDHGGGPSRDMLEIAQRWQKSAFFPKLEFTTALNYLEKISSEASELPIWNDELYLEFHRGCYTTHADQKRWNRRCEELLYQAELFASFANISNDFIYPKGELEAAWKKTLFNQFHDILPGTSINQVFVEANAAWQEVEAVCEEIIDKALQAIASQITLPTPPQPNALPLVIFNPLNWQRSEVVSVSLPASASDWAIYDLEGKQVTSQNNDSTLLFLAKDIPSIGYRLFWLCPQEGITDDNSSVSQSQSLKKQGDSQNNKNTLPQHSSFLNKKTLPANKWILENQLLRVTIDPETGDLSSIFDKVYQREILDSKAGNQLQAFQDRGQYWDAWNIDPKYSEYPLPPTTLKSIDWLESGEIQQRIRVIKTLGKSEFCQDYILSAESPLLKISTTVDWQESHVLVKAAFPLNLEAEYVTYEIACGAIQRPTQPETPAEKAKWEVPALRWADLTENQEFSTSYGVSLLNDCKYGYDCQKSQLRLTLLRSPSWPDPEADRGYHQFTYAIYPHNGNWQQAQTVRRGYELNVPLKVMILPAIASSLNQLPAFGKLLDLSAENLILMAFKQSEDHPNSWILRCYECHGETAELSLESDLGLSLGDSVDILERSPAISNPESHIISPWKIASFTVNFPL